MITLSDADWAEYAVTCMGATHLVSLISWHMMIDTPGSIRPDNHLKLEMDDITTDREGLRCPDITHIDRLLDFGERLHGDAELVVHCQMGRSRSAAAVLVLLAQRNPNREREIVDLVFRDAPHIRPNSLIIELADKELGCDGSLIQSVDGLPRSTPHDLNGFVSFPFALS